MNGTLQRQFSLANIWDRVVRVVAVIAAFIAEAGVPATPQSWALLVGAVAAASYTGASKPPPSS
jgi:hypothetical protein